MKPKPDSRTHSFKPVKMNREDIQDVLELLKTACEDVELSDEKNLYESLDEMENRLGKRAHCIKIRTHDPFVSVDLGTEQISKWMRHDQNFLYANADKDAHAVFFSVRDRVLQHESGLYRVFNFYVFVCVLLIDILFTWLRIFTLHLSPGVDETVRTIDWILFTGYCLLFTYFNIRGLSYLGLTPRNKRQSFWDRNADKFALVLVGTVVGILGTFGRRVVKARLIPALVAFLPAPLCC